MNICRRAVETDAQAIAVLGVDAWRAAYRGIMPDALLDNLNVAESAEAWRESLSHADREVFVVECDGQVAGYCYLLGPEHPRYGGAERSAPGASGVSSDPIELALINVDPRWWRRKVGSALLAEAMRSAQLRGFRELVLWVLEQDPRARKFYEAHGFSPDGAERVNQTWGVSLKQVRYRTVFSE